jgi:phytol kinase
MIKFLLLILVALAILLTTEFIRKRFRVRNESMRKTYHLVHGVLFGVAPFFVSYPVIIAIELILLVEMFIVRRFNLLPWLYEVGRLSWGDVFTVGGVLTICLLHPDKWVFLAAMLHLAFADSLAALIGRRYGASTSYKVFSQKKSLIGSLAFFAVSFILTLGALNFTPLEYVPLSLVLLLPPIVTLAENVSIYGSDNFVIPVVVVLLLRLA